MRGRVLLGSIGCVIVIVVAGCGGDGGQATTSGSGPERADGGASEHLRPADWELLAGAKKRAAGKREKRHHDLVGVAFAQARQIERCISAAGFRTATHIARNGPDSLGVIPVSRKESGRRLPVAETGLRAEHGYYWVGVAPTHEVADNYYYLQSAFPGGSVRNRARDGLVSLETVRFGHDLGAYAANLRIVASCAFSVPAAPGQPKWEFNGRGLRPIIRSIESG